MSEKRCLSEEEDQASNAGGPRLSAEKKGLEKAKEQGRLLKEEEGCGVGKPTPLIGGSYGDDTTRSVNEQL